MGSAKTKIGEYLRGNLEDSAELDLDLNADSKISSLDEVLGKENVVAEFCMTVVRIQQILHGLTYLEKRVTIYFQ